MAAPYAVPPAPVEAADPAPPRLAIPAALRASSTEIRFRPGTETLARAVADPAGDEASARSTG
ncbi:hypothetical protein [Micromonospora sp. RTGN7]|uniref:hypothetical protein n=1 Tax=Micromonospora sp. RTGN7 TaxID=3016526 RepID=UPI0029FF3454|nr:hypothetical protein [Micromonospora sp. RTGN7]